MTGRGQNTTQPVLVLLTDSPTQDGILNINKHHQAGREIHMSNKQHNPFMNSPGSEVSASCVLQTSSEPCSNRTSLETSAPSSATAAIVSSRKSVSFEETRHEQQQQQQLMPSHSREDFGLSQSSPFSSYANLASFDDHRRCSEEGHGTSKGRRHPKSNQTEQQCMLGVDSQATSAPMGILDDASAVVTAAERFRILRNANNKNFNSLQRQEQQQPQPQTAAQRLQTQTSGHINNGFANIPERKSSLPLPTGNSVREDKDAVDQQQQQQQQQHQGMDVSNSPPPPAPSPDLLRDFGEAYGAHLVSPRHSIDHSVSSLSASSSIAQLHQDHGSRNSIMGGAHSGAGVHHSHSNNSIAATSRSSLDVLLHGASSGSTPSRHSLDSLQDLLAAVGAGNVGGGRVSWESLGGTPRNSAPAPGTGTASATGLNFSGANAGAGGLGGLKKASHRLSTTGATHLENARLAMRLNTLSLDPLTGKNLIDNSQGDKPSISTATAAANAREQRYSRASEILSPSALRALTDSSMSVTVVAAPTKRPGAPTAAGPSIGAMASGLIDHYIPISGEHSSTPPHSGVGGGGDSSSLNAASTLTTGATTDGAGGRSHVSPRSIGTSINTTRSQPHGYMPSGHVAPPALLDADLHDTFGAHAWYCGPAILPNNRNRSNNSRRDDAFGTSAGNGGGGGGGAYNNNNNTRNANGSIMSKDGKRSITIDIDSNFRGGDTGGKQFSGGLAAAVAANDSSSAFSAAGTVLAGQQQQQQRHLGGNRGTAKHLELTSMPGQHSVTLHDAQCIVPSYDFLRQRQLAKAQQAKEGDQYWSGGYIAEAKKVLNEAMGAASQQEAEHRDSSYSGAIGPLLRHLNAAAGDNEKSRSALHTLGLLVSNLPNRGIIAELQGRHTLAAVLRHCTALDVREQAVTLLWDLDSSAGKDAAPVFIAEDLFALIKLLADTQHAAVASSALHFLHAAFELPIEVDERVELSPKQLAEMSQRVVSEVCAHKHRLQDAAQYTLGALLGAILNDPLITHQAVSEALESVLGAVRTCKDADQCQVLLTVLSSLAGNPRLLNVLAKGTRARDAVLQCGQNAGDQRVRARSLSLIKVLRSKDELPTTAAVRSSWYFGPEEDDTSTPATIALE